MRVLLFFSLSLLPSSFFSFVVVERRGYEYEDLHAEAKANLALSGRTWMLPKGAGLALSLSLSLMNINLIVEEYIAKKKWRDNQRIHFFFILSSFSFFVLSWSTHGAFLKWPLWHSQPSGKLHTSFLALSEAESRTSAWRARDIYQFPRVHFFSTQIHGFSLVRKIMVIARELSSESEKPPLI